jgi:hypothetical protein
MPAELQSTSHLKVVDVHEMSWIRLPAFASEEAKQRLSQIRGHLSRRFFAMQSAHQYKTGDCCKLTKKKGEESQIQSGSKDNVSSVLIN